MARVHGHPPSRSGPRDPARLPAAAPAALAAAVRPVVETLPALLPAHSGEQALRPASAAVVCAEPSGRGFRRDLCGVAAAPFELADAICWLAGAEGARICRRADGRDRGKAAADRDAGACRYAGSAKPDARRALQEEAGVLRLHAPQDLRPRSVPAVFSRSTASPLEAGFGPDPAAPRPYQAAGGAMDGRESAYTRCRARRDDLSLPRARSARRRPRTEARSRLHRPRDRQDDAHDVWPVSTKMDRAMRRLRILVLMHPDFVPPDSSDGHTAQEINAWKTEYDVVSTLRAAGHEVRPLGAQEEIKPVREAIEEFKPHVVFTLLEEFHNNVAFDQHIASYLELMKVPYTGCNPRGLTLARGKDLSKTLVHHRRIAAPAFAVFPMRRKVKRPTRLALPLIVKSLNMDGSFGISQASIVDTDEKLVERVAFIHERVESAAIAEQFIEGRELYVGVLGNNRLRVLPVWELKFGSMGGRSSRHIATEKAKHDTDYQEKVGIVDGPAKDLAPEVTARIQRAAKRIYRVLGLDGYARIDFRLTADGTPYFIEANPNPEIAKSQEFATAALHDGLKYPALLQRILTLGISRAKAGVSLG